MIFTLTPFILCIIYCTLVRCDPFLKTTFADYKETPANLENYSKLPPAPPVDDAARMARYIVHYTDWCAISHVSLQKDTFHAPVSRIFSMCDGTIDNSTGTPYIYGPIIDSDVADLLKDNRCSMTMSLAETDFCKNRSWDAEDPRCAQVTLTGACIALKNDTEEWKFARNALFVRHPIMKTWPKGHGWLVIKLNIKHISVVDYFGGNKIPSVEDYYKANPITNKKILNTVFRPIENLIKVDIVL